MEGLPATSLMTDAHISASCSATNANRFAAQTSAATDEERQNFYHIACLIMNAGAEVVRKRFVELLGNKSLEVFLRRCEDYVRGRNKKQGSQGTNKKPMLLDNYQWKVLVAADGSFASNPDGFDLSILEKLIDIFIREDSNQTRSLCYKPQDDDNSWEANLVRLCEKRNTLYGHVPRLSLKKDEYNKALSEVSVILEALGVPKASIQPTHVAISAEKLKDLERRYSRITPEDIQKNLPLVQFDIEQCFKLAVGSQGHFREVFETMDELRQRIKVLERSHTSGATGGNCFNFNGSANVQVGNCNTMVINGSRSQPDASSSGASHVSSATSVKKKIKIPNREVYEEDIERVEDAIGDAWRELGRQLKLSDTDLSDIGYEYRHHGLRKIAHEMLRKWHNRFGRNATVVVLANALVDIRKGRIAEALSE